MSLDRYFDSVRAYMPEEARAILDRQIPAIHDQISQEVDDWAKELANQLKAQIDNAHKAFDGELAILTKQISDGIASMSNGQNVVAAAFQLQVALNAYEAKWKDLGEKARSAALLAVKVAGLPITV